MTICFNLNSSNLKASDRVNKNLNYSERKRLTLVFLSEPICYLIQGCLHSHLLNLGFVASSHHWCSCLVFRSSFSCTLYYSRYRLGVLLLDLHLCKLRSHLYINIIHVKWVCDRLSFTVISASFNSNQVLHLSEIKFNSNSPLSICSLSRLLLKSQPHCWSSVWTLRLTW